MNYIRFESPPGSLTYPPSDAGGQANFFRNIGSILTFAFVGTFISAVVLGIILYLWTRISLEGLNISFVEAISVGATLSATDPVTILAIFNTYKVDPKLYTIIFGESILNDAIAIVLFETAQRYKGGRPNATSLSVFNILEGFGIFLLVFFGSLVIGVAVGIMTALGLKYTLVRRYPKIESCLVVLVAYASYFFSNGMHMSGEPTEPPHLDQPSPYLLFLTDRSGASLGLTVWHEQESSRCCSAVSP